MAMQRTPDGGQYGAAALVSNEELAQFYLEPEHLENEEITYELRVRGIDASGQRRELTARLRQALLDEKRGRQVFPRLTIGHPNTELSLARQHLGSMRAALFAVNNDHVTQQKFMSQYIHWEERVNRIPTVGAAPDVTDQVFALNEDYSQLYQEFVRHLTGLKQNRKDVPDIESGVPVVQMGADNVQHSDPLQSEVINEQSGNRRVSSHRSQSLGANPIRPQNYDELYRLPTGNTPRNTSADFGLLGQIISAPFRQPTSSQRFDLSGNPRLSSNFRQSGGRAITPISENNANNVQQERIVMRRSNSAAADVDTIERRNNSATGEREHELRRVRSAAAEYNSNSHREQIHGFSRIPSESFGENRRSSMPFQDEQSTTNRHAFEQNGVSVGYNRGVARNLFAQREHFSVRPDTEPIPHNDNHSRRSHTFDVPVVQQAPQRRDDYRSGMGMQNTNHSHLQVDFSRDVYAPHAEQRHRLSNDFNAQGYSINNVQGYAQPHEHPIQTNQPQFSGMIREFHTPSENVSRREFNAVLDAINALNDSIRNLNSGNRMNEAPVHTEPPPFRAESPMVFPRVYRNINRHDDDDRQSVRNDIVSVASHRSDTRQDRQYSRRQGLPIHKWDLCFTADKNSKIPEEKDLRAFFKKLDIIKEAEQTGFDEIFHRFHLLVKGNASEWYIQYRSKFRNWTELKAGLIKQYTTPLNKFMVTQRLARHRQGKYETSSEFISRMTREFDSMCVYDEFEKIPVIQNGLRDELRIRAMSREWNNVAELNVFLSQLEIADELHALSSRERPHPKESTYQPKFMSRRSVNAIEMVEECNSVLGEEEEEGYMSDNSQNSEEMELCAFDSKYSKFSKESKKFSGQRIGSGKPATKFSQKSFRAPIDRKMSCYSCKSESHLLRDCDKPVERVFCFKCGAEGLLSPNCTHSRLNEETKNVQAVARSQPTPNESTPNISN